MMEDVLRYIFSDKFADPRLVAELVDAALTSVQFEKEGQPKTFGPTTFQSIFFKLQGLGKSKLDATQPYGPKVAEGFALPDRVRIARVIRSRQFLQYYLRHMMRNISFDRDAYLMRSQPFGYYAHSLDESRYKEERKTWVTDYEALKAAYTAGEDIAPQLGLYPLWNDNDEEWIVVSFEVAGTDLHIPTILDARFLPDFVSAGSRDSLPRAWDWARGTWGLTDYVISPTAARANIRIEAFGIGNTSIALHHNGYIGSYTIPDNEEMDHLIQRTIRQIKADFELKEKFNSMEDLVTLTPREFEYFLSTLFERRGFATTVTKTTRDNGFDIIAHRNAVNGQGILIEVKHYTRHKVGIRILRELIGARYLQNDAGQYKLCLATTNEFSGEVRKAATRDILREIELLDSKAILTELQQFRNHTLKDIIYQNLTAR